VDPGARIVRSVLGAGARVGPVMVERSIVWPDAQLDADLKDAIALPDGRVVSLANASG
jgi:hypothetical protein